jgi:hypothetical protein
MSDRLQKPKLVRQVACSSEDVTFLDNCILDLLRQEFYQDHVPQQDDHEWIQYARVREPDRTQGRAEFYPKKLL